MLHESFFHPNKQYLSIIKNADRLDPGHNWESRFYEAHRTILVEVFDPDQKLVFSGSFSGGTDLQKTYSEILDTVLTHIEPSKIDGVFKVTLKAGNFVAKRNLNFMRGRVTHIHSLRTRYSEVFTLLGVEKVTPDKSNDEIWLLGISARKVIGDINRELERNNQDPKDFWNNATITTVWANLNVFASSNPQTTDIHVTNPIKIEEPFNPNVPKEIAYCLHNIVIAANNFLFNDLEHVQSIRLVIETEEILSSFSFVYGWCKPTVIEPKFILIDKSNWFEPFMAPVKL